jgi:excisionase family DNA binding protein
VLDKETEMNGELYEAGDFCLDVAIAPAGGISSGDQAAIDQVLRLVAEYYATLGADLGRSSVSPSTAALRRSPLGRRLRHLAAVARGNEDAVVADVRRQADDVIALLLRPLAATDFGVPAWFWQTSLGRLLAAAIHRTHAADDLFCPASAAERLNVPRATIDRWLADGTLDAVRDETGSPFVPARTIERLRIVARELEGPTWAPPDDLDSPIVA